MLSRTKSILPSLWFVFLFLGQQIVDFTINTYRLVSLYWICITLLVIITSLKLPIGALKYKLPRIFLIICVLGAMTTYLNGTSIGSCVTKAFFAYMGYVGFVYLDNHKIKSSAFVLLFLLIYTFFYIRYYQYDEVTRQMMHGDLFGLSSTNTIPIVINVSFMLWHIILKVYNKRPSLVMMVISLLNIWLISIQGSRAGIIVSVMLAILVVYDYFVYGKSKRDKHYRTIVFIFVIGIAAYYVINNITLISEIVNIKGMQGLKSYSADARGIALSAFFSKVDFKKLLFGMQLNTDLLGGLNRTYNAFVDFWMRYGLLPAAFLLCIFFRRVLYYKNFNISLFYFFPLLFYSMVESFWGGSLWDILLYMLLFYTEKLTCYEEDKKILQSCC